MSRTSGVEPAQRYTAELAGIIKETRQDRRDERGAFNADNPMGGLTGLFAQEKPFFLLDMFPYPSGKGPHVGHSLGYIAADTVVRLRRMKGENALYTMDYDASGLPAEQYAIQTGQHSRVVTEKSITNMCQQLRRPSLSHNRRCSLAMTGTEYVYRTQWIFLQIFNSRFDPETIAPDGSQDTARPIGELEDKLTSGEVAVPSRRSWAEFDRIG